jgi:hypothetical protein
MFLYATIPEPHSPFQVVKRLRKFRTVIRKRSCGVARSLDHIVHYRKPFLPVDPEFSLNKVPMSPPRTKTQYLYCVTNSVMSSPA